MTDNTQPVLPVAACKILQARHHAPFDYLGRHTLQQGDQHKTVIRVILPIATKASIVEPSLLMERLGDSAIFEVEIKAGNKTFPDHYLIEWHDNEGNCQRCYDPYSFSAQLSDTDLQLFLAGKQCHADKVLGAHLTTIDEIEGVLFSTWAPNAERISIVGDFNRWNSRCHAMRARGASGLWELFIPGIEMGERYLFEIRNHHNGEVQLKSDPYAQQFESATTNHAIVTAINKFPWNDNHWIGNRESNDWRHEALSIYEVHLGSWQHDQYGSLLDYRTLAKQLVEYVRELGFTHIELLSDPSGENACGYFSPSSQYGNPDDFKYFVDYCHQYRIGVILDWSIDHIPPSLNCFDGETLYEPYYEQDSYPSSTFDYSRNGVRNFLLSSALFWFETYHLDGLKLCTSTAMLYLKDQQNSDALSLLRELNNLVHQEHPGVLMITEENTAWPRVTQPSGLGGLGFSMKWNSSWLHDTLKYFSHETTQRHHHQNTLIFSQHYAFSECFTLPLSPPDTIWHNSELPDNSSVAQNSGALLFRMPGEASQRFANLRLLYSYMFVHPGKKLLFMGHEFAMTSQWNRHNALSWDLADTPCHQGLSNMVADLNSLYRNTQALYQYDFDERGFEWIDCHDSTQSLLVFRRNSDSDTVIVALNFSAVAKNCYRVGVPFDTIYKEIFNSDTYHYGGQDRINSSGIHAETLPWMKQPFSISITLPPLSALIIKPLHHITSATTP